MTTAAPATALHRRASRSKSFPLNPAAVARRHPRYRRCRRFSEVTASEDEVAVRQGDVVSEDDLEIGLGVAVEVARDNGVRAGKLDGQLARVPAEGLISEEREGLVATDVLVRVDVVDIDAVDVVFE